MATLRFYGKRPAAGAPACGRTHVLAIVDDQAFVIERDIGPFALGDEVAAGDVDRVAAVFFVAGEDDADIGILERAGGLHGAQCGDHHRHPALVVAGPRPLGPVALARPLLEGRVRFEYRVEVTDEEQALAGAIALVAGDDVAGSPGGAHGNPLHYRVDRLQLGP